MAHDSERDYGQEETLLGKEEDGFYPHSKSQERQPKLLWIGFAFAIVASLFAGFLIGKTQQKRVEIDGFPRT